MKIPGITIVLCLMNVVAAADELAEITNYREYSEIFASSGQPSAAQLSTLRDAGFERIIYIAFTNSRDAIETEDDVVRKLGMEYVHIPVVWDAPTPADFYAFYDVMQRYPEKKSLLHCQVNYRASAFSFLYRVIHDGVPVAEAKADMNTVWSPNETWKDLIFHVLQDNGISPQCEGCSWDEE